MHITHPSFLRACAILNLLFLSPAFSQSSRLYYDRCPLLAHFPPPHLLNTPPAEDPILGPYLKKLTAIFDGFSSNSSSAGFNTSHTSFSVLITHPNHGWKNPIWQYHYTAPISDPRGTKKVDADTVFRLGSVSKLVTMVGVVKAGLNLDDSIVKYVPELKTVKGRRNGRDRNWEEITVRSLGSHIAGVQRDFGWPELALRDPKSTPGQSALLQRVGLPPLPESEFPPCEFPPFKPNPCTTEQLLSILTSEPPVVAPFSQPIYSNTAFALLALAIENVTSMTFNEYMQEHVFKPLNMSRTFFPPSKSLPIDSQGSIPPFNDSVWGAEFGSQTPGGGVYSTTADLSKLLISLLPSVQNKAPIFQPHPAAAYKFLLPTSFMPSTNTMFLGAPWEIFRPEANHGGLTIYTKAGGVPRYSAEAVVIPEYDLVLSIAVSGDSAAEHLLDTILKYRDDGIEKGLLVGGFGGAARAETKQGFDGVYTAEKLNSTMTLLATTDSDGGIGIPNWISNGSDILSVLGRLNDVPRQNVEARMYPVDLVGYQEEHDGILIRKEEWKISVGRTDKPAPETGPKLRSFLEGSCLTFNIVEGWGHRYGEENGNRVVVWRALKDKDDIRGTVVALEHPMLRVLLQKEGQGGKL